MGKVVALLGLILIIVGLIPVIIDVLGITGLTTITDYFFMLNLIAPINLGGFLFSDIMLILIGLGALLFIIGLVK
jgi:hypothetical protein